MSGKTKRWTVLLLSFLIVLCAALGGLVGFLCSRSSVPPQPACAGTYVSASGSVLDVQVSGKQYLCTVYGFMDRYACSVKEGVFAKTFSTYTWIGERKRAVIEFADADRAYVVYNGSIELFQRTEGGQ